MSKIFAPFYGFNFGVASPHVLARTDLKGLRLACETENNFLPRVMGPAHFRPGTQYIAGTAGNNPARLLPFVFSAATKAVLELTANTMRVLVDDAVLTRDAVTAQTVNGSFTTNLASWTDADEVGATSDWVTGGYMGLTGSGSAYAIRRQQVTVTETGTEHALRIVVERGPIIIKIGSSSDGEQYISETSLRTGEHSLAFTPTGDFHITVSARDDVLRLVDSITVEAAGAVELPTPWDGTDMWQVRYAQSGDVLFCACDGIQQQQIERREQRSWSVVDYTTEDGPFDFANTTPTTLTPSATSGNITVTASTRTFKPGHVGALFRLTHSGQTAQASLSAADSFTDPIEISGVGTESRTFDYLITGTWAGTLTRQKASGVPSGWVDAHTWTSNDSGSSTSSGTDLVYYRIGFKAGEYTSGSANITLSADGSTQDGVVRVTEYTSRTVVEAEVLSTLGRAEATSNWAEGDWSDDRGWPSSVTFHDGRLWWGWQDFLYGSVSDAYDSFDDTVEGDSGPIARSIATGPFENIYWLLSIQRLMGGTASQEVSIRSSSFDEPLTPTAFTARAPSERGSANIQAQKIDTRGVFVGRNAKRVYQLGFSLDAQDYTSSDLTRLAPEICGGGIVEMAVQRQPDTRLWAVLGDGTAAVLTYEPEDEVVAWTTVDTDGEFTAVVSLPGDDEDEVYFVVKRTIGGVDSYYHEKLARLNECTGAASNKNLDSHVVISQASSTTITGLSHLIGEEVCVWAAGVPLVDQSAMKTVNGSGNITGLSSAVTAAVVGLPYTGRIKSAKLAFGAGLGTAMTQPKRVVSASLLMADVGPRGVQVGRSFGQMYPIPLKSPTTGQALGASTHVVDNYDFRQFPIRGDWGTDERLCIEVKAPYPLTLLGAVIGMQTNEGATPQQESGEG